MPRARKKPAQEAPATEPTPLAEVLQTLPVSKMLKQAAAEHELSDSAALKLLEESRLRKSLIDPERPMPVPEEPGKHVAAVLARRPNFLPVPTGYKNVDRYESAGIRVNRGIEPENRHLAAIQFAEGEHVPTRPEKDFLEAVTGGHGFTFDMAKTRQWLRETPPGMSPAENLIDVKAMAQKLAAARNEGLAR